MVQVNSPCKVNTLQIGSDRQRKLEIFSALSCTFACTQNSQWAYYVGAAMGVSSASVRGISQLHNDGSNWCAKDDETDKKPVCGGLACVMM